MHAITASRPAAIAARHFAAVPSRAQACALLDALNAQAGGHGPVPVDRPLVLYGAGSLGKLARHHLALVGVPIALVVDAAAATARQDPAWQGLDVVTPDSVPAALRREALLAVSIVNSPFVPLRDALMAAGWAHCVPFYDIAEGFRSRHPLGNGWFADRLDEDAMRCAHAVQQGWADAASRAHALRFAAWRLCRAEWDFADAPVDPAARFFIPEVATALGAPLRVLDVGAHHGTYMARLLAERPVEAGWMLEPDADNFAALQSWAGTLPPPLRARLESRDILVGARRETVRFHAGLGFASQIAPSGGTRRETLPIDALGLDPTVIKLHVEGHELSALEGARDTIARHRPLVMATIYHNADGLVRTPLWLMQTLPDYRVLMRTHGWCGTGAVVYAVPAERWAA